VKFCTLAELGEDGTVGKIMEVSLVGDDHEFGPDKDGKLIHIEGSRPVTVSAGRQYPDGPLAPVPGVRAPDPETVAKLMAGYE